MLKFFDKDLDTIEMKFLGLLFCILLGIISIVVKIDLITGFLGGIISMMVRDLYRTDTNEAKPPQTKGEGK